METIKEIPNCGVILKSNIMYIIECLLIAINKPLKSDIYIIVPSRLMGYVHYNYTIGLVPDAIMNQVRASDELDDCSMEIVELTFNNKDFEKKTLAIISK